MHRLLSVPLTERAWFPDVWQGGRSGPEVVTGFYRTHRREISPKAGEVTAKDHIGQHI